MTARALDQFYTCREVAAQCVSDVQRYLGSGAERWLWVEPSAGDGAFLDAMPFPRIALDICPRSREISCADFLSWSPGTPTRRMIFVGNPPFGKNSSIARRFFDHAARFGDVVAFVLPRTFQKQVFVDRLHPNMHLIHERVLPEDSFLFEDQVYAVPTVFQIWEKRSAPRAKSVRNLKHDHFSFVPAPIADFAFQRVGARAGLVSREGLAKSPQSHYFLKSHIAPSHLFERLVALDWNAVKWRTAGNPSIGKGELVAAYAQSHG
ncbi:MAG: SAM-dependent methyltransferase [Novosphingobium sp.]